MTLVSRLLGVGELVRGSFLQPRPETEKPQLLLASGGGGDTAGFRSPRLSRKAAWWEPPPGNARSVVAAGTVLHAPSRSGGKTVSGWRRFLLPWFPENEVGSLTKDSPGKHAEPSLSEGRLGTRWPRPEALNQLHAQAGSAWCRGGSVPPRPASQRTPLPAARLLTQDQFPGSHGAGRRGKD